VFFIYGNSVTFFLPEKFIINNMARSHHRQRKHHPQPPHAIIRPKSKRKNAGLVFMIFFGIFGLGIGYFAAGTTVSLVIGAIIGAIVGYLIGHNLDKMTTRK